MGLILSVRKITGYRITWHILFWFLYLAAATFVFGSPTGHYTKVFISLVIHLPIEMASVYITLYFLFPKYMLTRRFVLFAVYYLSISFILSIAQRGVDMTILGKMYYPEIYKKWKLFSIFDLAQTLIWIYMLDAITLAIKLSKYYFQKTIEHNKLIQEKLQAELKLLKSQIHPHFLFNTLNNLYALALKKSDKTAEGIAKLSDLLNYMLYDCNVPFIALKKEVDLIKDYIELEKLRYGDRLNISLNINGNTSGKKIAPMLILPFVENSFKHGGSTKLENTDIFIDLNIAINALDLKVENTRSKKKPVDEHGYTEGIGLKNVRRRLDLIYPDRYQLEINEQENRFAIHLNLML